MKFKITVNKEVNLLSVFRMLTLTTTILLSLVITGLHAKEYPELLTTKTITGICDLKITSFCPAADNSDADGNCLKMANAAERLNTTNIDAQCDDTNACSFQAKINGTADGLVYVSYKTKISDADPNSKTYKTCSNQVIIYSLYE